jgi:hypothetical protein
LRPMPLSMGSVQDWWDHTLTAQEREEVEQWFGDRDRTPFPYSAGVKQVTAGLISPGRYVGEFADEVEQFLRHRFTPSS